MLVTMNEYVIMTLWVLGFHNSHLYPLMCQSHAFFHLTLHKSMTYLLSSITAKATLTIASESRCSIKQIVTVDPAGACFQTDGRLQSKVSVFRPNTGSKAIAGVIGQCNSFLRCTKAENSQYWTKYLRL